MALHLPLCSAATAGPRQTHPQSRTSCGQSSPRGTRAAPPFHTLSASTDPPPTPAPAQPHLNPAHSPPCAPRLQRPSSEFLAAAPPEASGLICSTPPRGVKLVKHQLGTTNLGGLAGPAEGIAGTCVTSGGLLPSLWMQYSASLVIGHLAQAGEFG